MGSRSLTSGQPPVGGRQASSHSQSTGSAKYSCSSSGLPAMSLHSEADSRSDMIRRWEFFYFESLNPEKTSTVTFSRQDEVIECEDVARDVTSLKKMSQKVKMARKLDRLRKIHL